MAITRNQYLEAYQIVRQYELEEREKWLDGLKKPCPKCGDKTNDSGDCRKCGIVYLNGVHQINNCTEYHTHGNDCYVPFVRLEKI